MNSFKLHTPTTAPAGSVTILQTAKKGLGFIPNLYARMADAPTALQAYKQLGELLEHSELTLAEQQVVLISASVENNCAYCVAAHSFLARNLVKVSGEVISALRNGEPVPDKRLNALARLTRAIVRERGWVAGSQELNDFFEAGYTAQNALEVVLGVTMKTLSNYVNHITDIPLDATFAGEAWKSSCKSTGACAH